MSFTAHPRGIASYFQGVVLKGLEREAAQNRRATEVSEWRSEAQDAINDTVRGLRKLWDVFPADSAFLFDAVRGLSDECNNLDAQMKAQLDDYDLPTDDGLDLSDVRELLAMVKT